MHIDIHTNKKIVIHITLTFLLSLYSFSINGMWNRPAKENIANRAIMLFKSPNDLQLHRFYAIFIEGLIAYNPEQRYSKEETVIYDHKKNAFIFYDEDLKSTNITDDIVDKFLALKICLQVNKLSYAKLKPVYNAYIKHIFENFLFDQDKYNRYKEINNPDAQYILGKGPTDKIKKTVITAIKEKDFSSTNRILFDILAYGTTQWYVDHDEKIIVSTWGKIKCKDDLFQLIQESNPHITDFLKTVINNIPKDYRYLIIFNHTPFTITPNMYDEFKRNHLSIRKDEGYLLVLGEDNNHRGLVPSLSIKALANT